LISRKTIRALLGAVTLLPPVASAQSGAPDTIFVTGSRTGLRSDQIGSAVSVITRGQIEAEQILLGKNILQDVPGVQISNDRPGAVTSVYIRGADNDQVLVLVDGQEVGDPSNIMTQYQFDHLRTNDIERIEVLRGNQSSLYGSDAIGGVINIITRRPAGEGLELSLDAEAGSYGMQRLDLGLSGVTGLVDYRVSVGSLASDGPSRADPNAGPAIEDDAYDNLGFSAKLGVDLLPDLTLELNSFAGNTETELDGTGEDATPTPLVEKDEAGLGIMLSHGSADGRWRNQLSLSRYDAERVYQTSGDRLTGDKTNVRVSSAVTVAERVSLAFGLDLEDESTDQLTSYSGSFLAQNETDSLFAELAVTPFSDLTLSFAARRDDNQRFGAFDTHRVTAAWQLDTAGPATKLRASWGTGAKAPGLYQLFDPAFGNTGLGVEESEGYDIGVDVYWSGGATLEVSYFANDLQNEIDFLYPAGFLNLGRTHAKGVETYVSLPLGERVDWSFSYTYLDSRDRDTDVWFGRPRNALTTRFVIAATSRLRLTTRARYRSMNAASYGGTTDSFVVVDLLGSYELMDNIEVYGRIVNLFDEDYQYEWGSSTYDLSAFAGVRIRY
jgi:vitamin B12 transporter